MKKIVPFLCSILVAFAACSKAPASLEELALSRLPKALEQAMTEELSVQGGADIVSPEIMYSCDSLCIIQFKAVAKAPHLEGYSFPARYVLVQDMVLSHAYGHPVYAEKLTGCPEMDEKEMEETKARFLKDAEKTYIFYAATANSIAPEDL